MTWMHLPGPFSRFSELPFIYPEISEADLNPVFLLHEGLVVGDVRIIKKSDFFIFC